MYKKIYYVKRRFLRSIFFTIFTILKLFSKISSPNAGIRGIYGNPTLRAMHSIHKCVAKDAPHLFH